MKHKTLSGAAFVFFLTIAFIFSAATFVTAATFTVTRSDSRNGTCNSGVDCSLREAVKAAGALAGEDTVDFAANVSTISDGNIYYGTIFPAPPALGAIKIIGRGAEVFTIDAGGSNLFIIENSVVTISNVTLTGARGNKSGGAISASGSLTLDGVHIVGNRVFYQGSKGGGVNSSGTLIIRNSTFSNNQAPDCGAINHSGGTLTMTNSTISGNFTFPASGLGGGGIGGDGAGLCSLGNSTLRNVTITNNAAPPFTNRSGSGGGVYVGGGTFNFGNTIIAGNSADSTGQPEIRFTGGSIISAGNNIIGDSPGDASNTTLPVTYHPTDKLETPPMLGALSNNGGKTPTHALLPGSPAIDAGDNAMAVDASDGGAALTFDQRGYRRIVDGEDADTIATVDIGAVEAARTVNISGRITARGRGAARARVTFSDDNGLTQTVMTNPFGYYRFANVPVGDNYTFEIKSKQYRFAPRTANITEQMSNFNFVAN